ncbi:MAG: hypothetical protein RRY36_09850 [Bacteroidaceae bacterium]
MKKLLLLFSLLLSINIYSKDYTDADSYYYDGTIIQFYDTPDVFVSMYITDVDYYGHYYAINLSIINKSNKRFDFIPEEIVPCYYEKDGGKMQVSVLSFLEYEKIVNRKQGWQESLSGLAVGLQSFSSSMSPAYSASISSNYSQDKIKINVSDNSKSQKDMDRTLNDARKLEENNRVVINRLGNGYLKRNTLFGNCELNGYINMKYVKCDKFNIVLPINGSIYEFNWTKKVEDN